MAILKKYVGAFAVESTGFRNTQVAGETYTNVPTISYKDTSGTSRNTICWRTFQTDANATARMGNNFMQTGLTPVATADVIEDYNVDDYTITSIGTTTCTSSTSINGKSVSLSYSVNIANNTENDITVSCIKFKKTIHFYGDSTSQVRDFDILMYGYFLDEPITILAGQNQTIGIVFSMSTNVTIE